MVICWGVRIQKTVFLLESVTGTLDRVCTRPESWKSYGKSENQIPGLEKLWKNVILVTWPGNVLEFILELHQISRSSTFKPDFHYWGERTGDNPKIWPKNPNLFKNMKATLQGGWLGWWRWRNLVCFHLGAHSFRKNMSWNCPENVLEYYFAESVWTRPWVRSVYLLACRCCT